MPGIQSKIGMHGNKQENNSQHKETSMNKREAQILRLEDEDIDTVLMTILYVQKLSEN
jgi:hypothetical protein